MPWRNDAINNDLREKCGFEAENLCNLDQYDSKTMQKVLGVLLEWACYPQNDTTIIEARSKIAEIPRKCLENNLIKAARQGFDYSDDWNYRRLLELADELIPLNMAEFISLNADSDDPDIMEIIEDYTKKSEEYID